MVNELRDVALGDWGIYQIKEFDITMDLEKIPFWHKLNDKRYLISSKRFDRPKGNKLLYGRYEPIIKADAEKGHAIVVSMDNKEGDDPLLSYPKLYYDLSSYRAITFINKFPTFLRFFDNLKLENNVKVELRKYDRELAKGICLVSIPTKDYVRIVDVDDKDFVAIFLSHVSAMRNIYNNIKIGDIHFPYYFFFNIGKNAGATVAWVHAQTWIDISKGSFFKEPISFSDSIAIIRPKKNAANMIKLGDKDIADFSLSIKHYFNDLDNEGSYNILIHQAPFGYKNKFNMYAEIIKRKDNPYGLGGYEYMANEGKPIVFSSVLELEKFISKTS